MKKLHMLLAALLTITTIIGAAVPVQAASSDVNIEIKATTMDEVSVTVPTSLPIIFNEDGSNTLPTNWTIDNRSTIAGIHLSQIDMDSEGNGWKLLDDTKNTKTMPVNTKSIQFSMGKEGALKLVTPTNGDEKVAESGTGVLKLEANEINLPSGTAENLFFHVERGAFTDAQASAKAFKMVLTFNFN